MLKKKPKPINKVYCHIKCPFLIMGMGVGCTFGCEGKSYSIVLDTDGIYPTTALIYRSEQCKKEIVDEKETC